MDFEEREHEQEGLPKWPFLVSALFILSGALGFAYHHYHFSGQLEIWQLLVCILASGTASLLIFMPFLLERSLQLCLQTANRKDDELFRKVYFDLKEVGNELETLSVKVDKVPTLVDKIVSDSTKDITQITHLSETLNETKEELALKLERLEEFAAREPELPEPDPEIARAHQSITELSKSITSLSGQLAEIHAQIAKLPTEFPAPIIQAVQETVGSFEQGQPPEEVESADILGVKVSPESPLEEILTEDAFSPDPAELDSENEDIPHNSNDDSLDLDDNPPGETPDSAQPEAESLDETGLADKENAEMSETEIEPQQQEISTTSTSEPELQEETFENLEFEDLKEAEQHVIPVEEVESIPMDPPDELDLGLPDPEETLRKVDALLADKPIEPSKPKEPSIEDSAKRKPSGGITSVIAKVMIGIGNKPYVRGQGPGLSWEEGVPMNFMEIGKWAWSPPRKNVSVTIQIYRNDEDPDNTGKHEIKAGEKFELTPDFD